MTYPAQQVEDLEAKVSQLEKRYAEGLDAWKANNAHHAREIARLEGVVQAAHALLQQVLAHDDAALLEMQEMGLPMGAPPITQEIRAYLAEVAKQAAKAQNGPT